MKTFFYVFQFLIVSSLAQAANIKVINRLDESVDNLETLETINGDRSVARACSSWNRRRYIVQ